MEGFQDQIAEDLFSPPQFGVEGSAVEHSQVGVPWQEGWITSAVLLSGATSRVGPSFHLFIPHWHLSPSQSLWLPVWSLDPIHV